MKKKDLKAGQLYIVQQQVMRLVEIDPMIPGIFTWDKPERSTRKVRMTRTGTYTGLRRPVSPGPLPAPSEVEDFTGDVFIPYRQIQEPYDEAYVAAVKEDDAELDAERAEAVRRTTEIQALLPDLQRCVEAFLHEHSLLGAQSGTSAFTSYDPQRGWADGSVRIDIDIRTDTALQWHKEIT